MSLPADASLDGCYAKLRRAIEHFEAFEDEAGRVLENVSATTTFAARYDPDVPRFLVHVVDEPMVPLRLSTIAGDLVHNLRSCLDHLAYQLLILAGDEWDDPQWPIVADLTKIDSNRRFKGLRDRLIAADRADIWTKIEGYQAHNYVDQFTPGISWIEQRHRDLPLLVLHELSNIDKHRLLFRTSFNVAEYQRIQIMALRDCTNPVIIDNTLWFTLKKDAPPIVQFRVEATGPDPSMEVEIDFTVQPVFLADIPVGPANTYLPLLLDAVGALLDDFAELF